MAFTRTSHAIRAMGPRIASSTQSALKFWTISSTANGWSRAVCLKMSQPEMYQEWLNGQSA